jgi:hypothetical protein
MDVRLTGTQDWGVDIHDHGKIRALMTGEEKPAPGTPRARRSNRSTLRSSWGTWTESSGRLLGTRPHGRDSDRACARH